MTKDRLKELQKPTPWPRVSYRKLSRQSRSQDQSSDTEDVVSPPCTTIQIDNSNESHVIEFLAQIDLIRLLIDKIDELAKEVKRIHMAMLEPIADQKLGQQLDDKTGDIKKLAYDISTKLKKMENTIELQTDAEKCSAQGRIKESQIFVLTRRFRNIMNQYNQDAILHRDRCKKAISRELEIAGTRKTDDELEELLESGYPGAYSFSVLMETNKAKQALNEIEARHRDITKIEHSIQELHGMFADLAILVTTQGEMIDNIEHNVLKTVNAISSAATEVEQARKKKEEAQKKKLLIITILIIIALLLILFISVYVFIQKKFFLRR